MSILKIETRTPKSLQEIYNYMVDENKTTKNEIFGIYCNPLEAVTDMQLTQNIYHSNYLHPYIQFMFIFDVEVNYDLYVIKSICKQIGYTFIIDKRHIFGAIHYKNLEGVGVHCHYVINSVGLDGSRYEIMHYLKYYKLVNEILDSYGLNPIKMSK